MDIIEGIELFITLGWLATTTSIRGSAGLACMTFQVLPPPVETGGSWVWLF